MDDSFEECYQSAIEAMQWKDEQYEQERQQIIDKACEKYCNCCDSAYMACRRYNYDKMHCKRYLKFKKAMDGWVKLYRKLTESALWTSEPFTKGQAWVDLIAMANHKDERVYINGNWVEIKRGQLHTSELKLAARWRWSKNKVTRFLEVLRLDGMLDKICSKGGLTNGTTLTLVNYSIYQGGDTTNETTNDTTNGQRTIQRLEHKQEYKECKELENIDNNPLTPLKGKATKRAKKSAVNIEPLIADLPTAVQEIARMWVDYKKQQFGFTYKYEKSFEIWLKDLYKKANGDIDTMRAIVEQSIGNGYQGIIELKKSYNGNRNNPNSADYVSTERIVAAGLAMANANR